MFCHFQYWIHAPVNEHNSTFINCSGYTRLDTFVSCPKEEMSLLNYSLLGENNTLKTLKICRVYTNCWLFPRPVSKVTERSVSWQLLVNECQIEFHLVPSDIAGGGRIYSMHWVEAWQTICQYVNFSKYNNKRPNQESNIKHSLNKKCAALRKKMLKNVANF